MKSYYSKLMYGAVLTVFCVIYLYYGLTNSLSNLLLEDTSTYKIPVHRERKNILVWTPFFGKQSWLPSTEDLGCSVSECDLTEDRSQLENSSVVLFHWRDVSQQDLPHCLQHTTNTTKCPLMVLLNHESPENTPVSKLGILKNQIHWTVSYRRDSNIYSPYGHILPNIKEEHYKIDTNRSAICWMVSNCHTSSHREDYVKNLQKHIDVEIYGKCGSNKCPYDKASDCYQWLSQWCTFYLSFENSICTDYVTEKLFFPLIYGMVPVVMGDYDYAKYLPENSFINVGDFSGPLLLAEYIRTLNADWLKYETYLRWKEKYHVKMEGYGWLCGLCEKLHNTKGKVNPYTDIETWWFNESSCDSF